MSGDHVKVAFIGSPKTTVEDLQWNQYGYESLLEAKKKRGFEAAVSQAVQPDAAEARIRDYAQKGYNLILVHHSAFEPTTIKLAEEFTDTYFSITMNAPIDRKLAKDVPNYSYYVQSRWEVSYLMGILAASLTKKKRVGVITLERARSGSLRIFVNAATKGVKAYDPAVQVFEAEIGPPEDFARGRKAVLGVNEKGCDTIVQTADGGTFGMIHACKDRQMYTNGAFCDQNELAPDLIYTSYIPRTPIVQMVDDIKAGKYQSMYNMTLANDGLHLAPYHKLGKAIPTRAKDMVEEAKRKIVAGKLDLSEDYWKLPPLRKPAAAEDRNSWIVE